MNGKIAAVLLSGLLFACVQTPPPEATATPPPVPPPPVAAAAPAEPVPANRWVSIRTIKCQRLLELSDDDRAAASMFYIGYQSSRVGARVIDVGALPSAEIEAVNYCQQFPNRSMLAAFRHAYWQTQQ